MTTKPINKAIFIGIYKTTGPDELKRILFEQKKIFLDMLVWSL